MKKISQITIIILVLSICLSFTALASTDVVEPTEQFYVADYANVLSSETEEYIIEKNDELYASCGGQFCVVTIDFLNDLDAEQYSYALFNEWGIGGAEHNNGSLLLMVIAEDKYWMSCGSGIEDVFTAGKMNTILMENFEDDFLSGNYDDAAVNTTAAVMDWYESYYGISSSSGTTTFYPEGGTYESYETEEIVYHRGIPFRTILKIIIVAAIVIFILGNMNKKRAYNGSVYGAARRSNPWPFLFFMSSMNNRSRRNHIHHDDRYHHRTNTRPPSGGFGNSSFGGSSFRSSGSGFRSSGGGSRSGGSSFRGGGGGSSRGGGAGRK